MVAGRSRKQANSPQAISRPPYCAVSLRRTAWSGMAWARHGKCESDTAALCKSRWKNTFLTLSGKACQENSMGAAWARLAMCESALVSPKRPAIRSILVGCIRASSQVSSSMTASFHVLLIYKLLSYLKRRSKGNFEFNGKFN